MISGWKEEIQRNYLTFLQGHPKATPSELATHLNQSEGCAIYWLTDLDREAKVRITGVELVEEDTASFEPKTASPLSARSSSPCLDQPRPCRRTTERGSEQGGVGTIRGMEVHRWG